MGNKKADKACPACIDRDHRVLREGYGYADVYVIKKVMNNGGSTMSRPFAAVMGYENALVAVQGLNTIAGMDFHVERGDEIIIRKIWFEMEPALDTEDVESMFIKDGRC